MIYFMVVLMISSFTSISGLKNRLLIGSLTFPYFLALISIEKLGLSNVVLHLSAVFMTIYR
jgi:hypothetical protein